MFSKGTDVVSEPLGKVIEFVIGLVKISQALYALRAKKKVTDKINSSNNPIIILYEVFMLHG
jgi:hypothetical protein